MFTVAAEEEPFAGTELVELAAPGSVGAVPATVPVVEPGTDVPVAEVPVAEPVAEVPAAELDAAVDALCKQIMAAPRPARVGCKDYARAALDMDVAGAIDFARSIHAVINSSSEMLPAGHK